MFSFSSFSQMTNFTLLNVSIIANNSSYVGSLVGTLSYGYVTYINLNTSSKLNSNTIISNDGDNLKRYFGGLIGEAYSSSINNIKVQNTLVNAINNSFVGGVIGFTSACSLIKIYNFGFQSAHTSVIVHGTSEVGGLFGRSSQDLVSSCGVAGGLIIGKTSVGAIAGSFFDPSVNTTYA
eukprot:TRINITY_DN7684_c0_g1_i1.p1 TRINITY_DN7684_c0_g1~~TRINITY_DN7684_c0_g1_i1.p1  ORF type:complete len:179 (-),score=28.66 TRINITY_DN7684_c0_g1_i1:165-701(-)